MDPQGASSVMGPIHDVVIVTWGTPSLALTYCAMLSSMKDRPSSEGA